MFSWVMRFYIKHTPPPILTIRRFDILIVYMCCTVLIRHWYPCSTDAITAAAQHLRQRQIISELELVNFMSFLQRIVIESSPVASSSCSSGEIIQLVIDMEPTNIMTAVVDKTSLQQFDNIQYGYMFGKII